jgi:disease resistance protein RPM1
MLVGLKVDSACIAEELGHLTQLRYLAVHLRTGKEGRWDENMCTALVGSLGKLNKIQYLWVYSDDVAVNLDGSVESLGNLSYLCIYRTTSLPTWIRPAILLHLSSLVIVVVQVRREDIQVLGRLQALCYLDLTVYGVYIQVLERFMVSPDSFPGAISCRFDNLKILDFASNWRISREVNLLLTTWPWATYPPFGMWRLASVEKRMSAKRW